MGPGRVRAPRSGTSQRRRRRRGRRKQKEHTDETRTTETARVQSRSRLEAWKKRRHKQKHSDVPIGRVLLQRLRLRRQRLDQLPRPHQREEAPAESGNVDAHRAEHAGPGPESVSAEQEENRGEEKGLRHVRSHAGARRGGGAAEGVPAREAAGEEAEARGDARRSERPEKRAQQHHGLLRFRDIEEMNGFFYTFRTFSRNRKYV